MKYLFNRNILIGVFAGLAGFAVNCWPLSLFPGIHLVFSGAMAVAIAVLVAVLESARLQQRALTNAAEMGTRQAEERAQHVAALNSLWRDLSSNFDLRSICRAARCYIQTQVNVANISISLYDNTEQYFTYAYSWTEGAEIDPTTLAPLQLNAGPHSLCLQTKQPVLADEAGNVLLKEAQLPSGDEQNGLPCVLYLPLIAFDNVVGIFEARNCRVDDYSEEAIERLMLVASQIAISLSNAHLFDQLAHAKIKWERTFDSMSEGIFVFGQTGRLMRVNRAGAAMEGVVIKSLIGRRCCEILPSFVEHKCLVSESLNSGQRVIHEIESRRNKRPLLITVEPLNIEGEMSGVVCIVRDLTDLRRAEAEARAQKEFTSRLVEFAQEAIYTFDRVGHTTWFNHRICEMTGYSSEAIHSCNMGILVHPDDLSEANRRSARALHGEHSVFEGRYIRRDGEVRWFRATYSPVKAQEEIGGVLVVARDVTDERLAAEQMERSNKLAAVGQLAAGVAHDFNNLLAAILGRAQLLKRHARTEMMQHGLEVIETAALDGAATVHRLQNFARRSANETVESISIDDILHDVVELTRTRWRDDAQAKGIEYRVNLKCGASVMVEGSPSELREVFTNLIINALDAMPHGGSLSIQSKAVGTQVSLCFADTGAGMTSEVRQHIFEPFFSTKGHAGIGLGLAVSYGIVERHGGTIEAESVAGRGTTFTITLPIAQTRARLEPEAEKVALMPIKALVIDDEEIVRTTLALSLEELGHEVEQVASGREGLQLLKTKRFDVVLTDLSMPEMDGWTVARHVRAAWPETKVLLITGYGATIELSGEAAQLVDAIICKPFDLNELSATLAHAMQRSLVLA